MHEDPVDRQMVTTPRSDVAGEQARSAPSAGDITVAAALSTAALSILVGLSGLVPAFTRFVYAVVALAAAALSLQRARRFARLRPLPIPLVAACIAAVGVAATSFLPDVDHRRTLYRVAGIALLLLAIAGGIGRERRDGGRRASDITLLVSGLSGLSLALIPLGSLRILVVLVGLLCVAWLMVRAAVRAHLLDFGRESDDERPLALLSRWFRHNGGIDSDRDQLVDGLFFEGPSARTDLVQYVALMVFASTIASMGVITDSTAVVIGAMLIAPLMTPIMAVGFALTMGWPERLRRSALLVLLGIAIAITTGILLSAAVGGAVDVASNSQILSRAQPSVPDLVIAVAAGAAGAYARARRSVASAMPGVAIAIALVPPLTVVGITAHHGSWNQSAGTLLLFLTNLVAIVLVGGLVFLVTGLAPSEVVASNQKRVRTSLIAVAALAMLVIGGLLVNGKQITQRSLAQDRVRRTVTEWLGAADEFGLVSVSAAGDRINVVLAGPGEPPSLDRLAAMLDETIDGDLEVDVQWVPRERRVLTIGG